MDENEFIGEFREFRGEMKEFKETACQDIKDIKVDVKGLNNFKWRVAGGAALLSLVLTLAAQLVSGWIQH